MPPFPIVMTEGILYFHTLLFAFAKLNLYTNRMMELSLGIAPSVPGITLPPLSVSAILSVSSKYLCIKMLVILLRATRASEW